MDYIRRFRPRRSVPYAMEAIVFHFQRLGFRFTSENNISQASGSVPFYAYPLNMLAGIDRLKFISHPDEIEVQATFRPPVRLMIMAVVLISLPYLLSNASRITESLSAYPLLVAFLVPLGILFLLPKSVFHRLTRRKLDRIIDLVDSGRTAADRD